MAASAEVAVIDIVHVGGYRATTLKASDTSALATYLTEHDYKTTPTLEKWLDFYVKKGWYLTAFQVESKEEIAETGVICMKFHTDSPFNPYYVPEDNKSDQPAGLSLSYISDQYASPGKVGKLYRKWQIRLTSLDVQRIAKFTKEPSSHFPTNPFLVHYEDFTFPNDAKNDIYFAPQQPPSNLLNLPEKLNRNALPITIVMGLAFAAIAITTIRKRKGPGTPNPKDQLE